jgi:glycerol-3-phosphate dehydrogenase
MNSYDVGIVGAGVVGCAIARELAHQYRTTPLRIIVLEKHEEVGEESSGRNSGVLHSGIHEQPFSLKERLAREGSALAVSYASQHSIPLLRTGMVIAISWDDIRRGLWRELSTLRRLWFNAWRTKTRVTVMTSSGLRAWEPNLRACCGIVIPSVSVIDAHAFVHSLRTDAEANGVEFAFNNKLVGIEADALEYILTTDRQRIRAACLVNAAGLHADEVAALATGARNYTIRPLRGEYYEVLSTNTKNLTKRLVYPALPSHAAGKGIHFSPRPNGRLFVGPNAVRVEDKTDYTSRKTPPGLFVEALQKFLPALEERDLRWAYSGIRACVMTGNGGKSDFIIATDCEDPPLINLVGIESPGLSAALAIARYVRKLPCLQRRLHPLRP